MNAKGTSAMFGIHIVGREFTSNVFIKLSVKLDEVFINFFKMESMSVVTVKLREHFDKRQNDEKSLYRCSIFNF